MINLDQAPFPSSCEFRQAVKKDHLIAVWLKNS